MSALARRLGREPQVLAGLALLSLPLLAALAAPLIAGPPDLFQIERRLEPPSLAAPFGTDRMGADIFAGVVYGARTTLVIAASAVVVATLIGTPVGLLAGYWRNRVGDALMRVSDLVLAVPQIVFAIAVTQALEPSTGSVILALSLTYWPFWARPVYAETCAMRNEIHVEAAIALGASPARVMGLHILPAIASTVVVRATLGFAATIMAAATLSFLGVGPPPPTPEWGRMIAESREHLPGAWWYPLAPGAAIFVTVLGLFLLGDGIRDVADPRARRPG